MFIASGVGNGLNYLFSMGLARVLGPVEFGLYAIGVTYFNILSQIAPLGAAIGVIKFVSESMARNERAYAYDTIKLAIKITLISSMLIAAILAAGAMPISHYLYSKPDLRPVLILFAIAIPFAASTTVLVSALQALQIIKPTILIKYVWEPVGKVVLAGATLFMGYHLLGAVAAIGLVIAVGTYMAIRVLQAESFSGITKTESAKASRFQEFVLFSSPVAISNIFGVVAPRSDILILGYWVSAQEIGVYLACLQTAGIITLVLGAFETAFAPFIARVLMLNDEGQLKTVYQSLSRLVVLFTVPLWVLLNMLADPILGSFGDAFRAGWVPLAILTTGHLVSSMASSPNHILLMGGHSQTVMLNTIIIGVLQIVVSLILVQYLGTVGAAVAATGALLTITLTRVFQVWRRYHILPVSIHLLKPVVGGMVMMVTIFIARQILGPAPYGLDILIIGALGLAAYLGCQLVFGLESSEKSLIESLIKRVSAQTSGVADEGHSNNDVVKIGHRNK
ncbi:MAG: oligosaccharide flippase family protein [Nitrospira sp.]|nr:oligosaccharide flippase family protein [Nitrospira sp.]